MKTSALRISAAGLLALIASGVGPCQHEQTVGKPCPSELRIAIKTVSRRPPSPLVEYAAAELVSYAETLFGSATKPVRVATDAEITLLSDQTVSATPSLDDFDSYQIVPTASGVEIRGSNDRSTLYGAYELIRLWGVQFYLSGDVMPEKSRCVLPVQAIAQKAVMKMRGVHPYPDFLSGPSIWDEEHYEKYLRQLPKLGLNFFGIHQYTYEPYLDYEVDGVHPRSGHLETASMKEWGYGTQQTCEFEVGRNLFDGCDWGSRAAMTPKTPEERYLAGERLMAFALNRANELGLVTAFGFEPMSHDPEFAELAKTVEGQKKVVEARINGVFRAFPRLDYLWLFADESNQANRQALKQTVELIGHAQRYVAAKAPTKRLMVGGWNTESTLREYDRSRDGVSFAQMTMFTSYGNYDPWKTVSERRYRHFEDLRRPHAIAAWCEYDGRLLTGIQPNVTAYEAMHPQILASGSAGFFFLHWNTRACDSNMDYLRQVAWQTEPLSPEQFYVEYFNARFKPKTGQGELKRLIKATLELEKINKTLSLSSPSLTLMGDDWTTYGPWGIVADAVNGLNAGTPLSENLRSRFKDQVKRARDISRQFAAKLELVEAAHATLNFASTSDRGTAAYLLNRTTFFIRYLTQYLSLSQGLDHVLKADALLKNGHSPAPELRQFATKLDMKAWLELVQAYTEFIDDRGELGIVVSLNQKILMGLRRLERSLNTQP